MRGWGLRRDGRGGGEAVQEVATAPSRSGYSADDVVPAFRPHQKVDVYG